ncbi:MAG: DUF11 domain-containing protein [Chloroflexi bacterium]|nr:DUF11 domain-containing protein [Chloroflexota bacterium]
MNNLLSRHRFAGIGTGLALALFLTLVIVQALTANPLDANLDNSSKDVSNTQASPGQSVNYTIVISNSGDLPASNVFMTDTLPAEVTLQGSLQVYTDNVWLDSYGSANGIITWTGSLGPQGFATITFQADLTDTLQAGDMVTNTAVISGAGSLITRSALTSIITETTLYFPVIFFPVPAPVLNAVPRPNTSNEWTVSWSEAVSNVTSYQLQEDDSADFSSPTTYDDMGTNLSRGFSHSASANNKYCYRVRALVNSQSSDWSNVNCIIGKYRDNFSDSSTGWAMRRQDTDSVINQTYYRNGHLVLEMDSSYDYQLSSPMKEAPALPYRIESRVKLVGVDNLHSYGFVFGGDWNGEQCPKSDYSSCFNHYYRLNIVWSGNDDELEYSLKRIDYHETGPGGDNSGRGESLFGTKRVSVNSPSEGYQTWAIEVYPSGLIKVFVNGKLLREKIDTKYINSPYFGVFSSTDEYTGLEAEFDWYEVNLLP